MFEFDKYSGPASSPTRPTEPYTPISAPRERAFLLWGEHCVECAAPDCYASCDLYDARPDRRCRRFEYGIFRNIAFPSALGYGAEVRFRRWGKLEARGNATMLPHTEVRRLEKLGEVASRMVNPVGRLVDKLANDIRWSYASFAMSERYNNRLFQCRDPSRLPEEFIVEVYNPGNSAVVLDLGMSINRAALGRAITADQLPPGFSRRLGVDPGYFIERIPLSEFRTIVESGLPFNIALTPLTPEAHLVFLTLDFVAGQSKADESAVPPSAAPLQRPAAKCVVFDLDNTLWDGVLVEGDVTLRPRIQGLFKALDERGILISVASKNAYDEALAKLVECGIEEYVLFPHVNWGPKSDSLRGISKSIDIGLDTLIFVDDNPFERAEVERALPMVEVLSDGEIDLLLDHPRLEGSTTAEAGKRRLMYREGMARASEQAAFGDNYLDFLRSCHIRVAIRPDRPADVERIAELVQRTNQLNFSGRKYSRDDLAAVLADPQVERYVLTVEDRFGSYGTVGFCIAEREGDLLRVRDFMLSCRVQGKFVEQALFHHLIERPNWAAAEIEIDFVRTPRNRLAEAVLDKLGFPSLAGKRQRVVAKGAFSVDFLTVESSWSE